jgi:hypothetical protein
MTTRIKLRRDTAQNWLDANPILAAGEPGLETDTGKIKYGDGETAYADLPHAGGDTLNDDGSVVVQAGSTAHWIATQRRDQDDTYPKALRYDSAGNLYALTDSNSGQGTVVIVTKYTAAGSIAWQKTLTGRLALNLAIDSSDQAYVVTKGEGSELQIIKFSTTGTVVWDKNYNYDEGTNLDQAFIEEKTSTSLVVAAAVTGPFPSYTLLLNISATNGSVNTQKTLERDGQNVYPTGIDVTDNGTTVYVTGYYYDGNTDTDKMFIEKMNSSLVRVWSKSLESGTNYGMYGGDCASDAQGNIYAVGTYQVANVNLDGGGNANSTAGILTKLNSSGVVQWTRRIGPGPCGGFAAGLTATDVGDVYLSALTYVNKNTGQFAEAPEYIQFGYGESKLIVARYDTQGAVIWQRYVDLGHLQEQFDSENIRGQAIAVHDNKFAVDGYGNSWDVTPNNFSSSDDNEYDYFVAQLPTDGTELTIGDLSFTESRVPGRFVTHAATDISNDMVLASDATTLAVTNFTTVVDPEARVANSVVRSETYDYTFGADGTLNIPNDGDLRLTQSQVGYLTAIGGSQNYNDDIYSRAVTVDTQGYMYLVGNDDDSSQPFVMKIDPLGARLWSVVIEDDANGNGGRANGVKIHPTTGNVIVVCEMYGDYTYSILVTIDQDTGRILDHIRYTDSDSDVYLNDIAYNSTGDYVLAGSKNGEFSAETTVTPLEGSTTGTLYISRSEIPGNPNSWQIGGTDISPFENLAYIERYVGVTGTVRQGSGAVFDITDVGDGTYYASGVQNNGINYLPGHKIKVLGTDLGGATPANDCTITVNSVSEGGLIFTWSVTGTAAGSTQTLYSPVTGTNINVGSGFTVTFESSRFNNDYANYNNYNITNGGSNYVDGDVIVIPGTSLGGTSPANDLTWTAYAPGGSVSSSYNLQGTSQSTTWKLETTTQANFGGSGSWSITYPLSRENLLITEDWTRTFGTRADSTDRLYAVAVDSSNNIIAVGEGAGLLGVGNTDSLAMVYKFNSAGALQWSRKLNERNDDCYAKSVVTIGTDIYVTHDSNDNGETVITKLDTTGTVKWQRITDSGDDSVIARTASGNLLVTAEAYNDDIGDDALKVFLLSPSGEVIYKRWLFATTDNDTRFKNGRCLAVDADSFYITGYFYANDYDSSMAARLPIDGSGTGEYGSFRYTGVNALTDDYFNNGYTLSGTNYDVDPIDLEGEDNYAGALAEGETVLVKTTATVTTGTGDFYVNTYFPNHTVEVVRDTDGGRIVFADGTSQDTSATDVPQRRYTGQRYTLGLNDRGRHILCTESNDNITIPYDARVEFPIGSRIMIINDSGSTVYVSGEGGSVQVLVSNQGVYSYFNIPNYSMATLIKIGRDRWAVQGDIST